MTTSQRRCCEPFHRVGPGHMIAFHSRTCPMWPGVQFGSERPRNRPVLHPEPDIAPRASHDWATCQLPGCLECAVFEYHLDDDDDARRSG